MDPALRQKLVRVTSSEVADRVLQLLIPPLMRPVTENSPYKTPWEVSDSAMLLSPPAPRFDTALNMPTVAKLRGGAYSDR